MRLGWSMACGLILFGCCGWGLVGVFGLSWMDISYFGIDYIEK